MWSSSENLSEARKFLLSGHVSAACCLFRTIAATCCWQLKYIFADWICGIWGNHKVYSVGISLNSSGNVSFVLCGVVTFAWKCPLVEIFPLDVRFSHKLEILQPIPLFDDAPLSCCATFTALVFFCEVDIHRIVDDDLAAAGVGILAHRLAQGIVVIGREVSALPIVLDVVPEFSRDRDVHSGVSLHEVLVEGLWPDRSIRIVWSQCKGNNTADKQDRFIRGHSKFAIDYNYLQT